MLHSTDDLLETAAAGQTSALTACASVLVRSARDLRTAASEASAIPADADDAARAIARALNDVAGAVTVISERLPAPDGELRRVDAYAQALLVALHDAGRYADLLADHLPAGAD